jgi:hypothetical protein
MPRKYYYQPARNFAEWTTLNACTCACRREKNLEKTLKETRLKAKKEANKRDGESAAACDEDLDALEADFYKSTPAPRALEAGG